MSDNPTSAPPTIRTVPFLRVLLNAFKFVENPIPVINAALEEYGPTYITRIFGGRRIIMTIDPDVVQYVLQKNNKNYYKSEIQTVSLGRYIGNGLLTANGDYWLRQRRLIQPGFHKARLAGLVHIMNEEIINYCDDLETRVVNGMEKVELSHEMIQLTLKVVSRSLFSSGISNNKIEELGKNFTVLQKHIVKEVRQPFLSYWRNLKGDRRRADRLAKETKQIVVDIIAERKQSGKTHDDLLDMLLQSRYEDTGEVMTDDQILDEAIILFTAGHETTANAMAWTFYLLSQNQQERDRLLDEFKNVSEVDLSFDGLGRMDICKNVISESLRLYPPAWILDRVALENDQVKGVEIKKGDTLGLFVYGSHRNTDFWENPDEFRPGRFDRSIQHDRPTYAYYPFGGGPRLCIGNHFAIMEMQLSLFHILSRFSFELIEGQEIVVQPLITLRPKNGIRMGISKI